MDFKKLFEPAYIGRVLIRNRMVKTGASLGRGQPDGNFTERFIALHEAIARGGIGLIILGSCIPDYPLGMHWEPSAERIDNDECIPRFSKFNEVIHKHGCPTFIQLYHTGVWHPMRVSGLQPVSSSPMTRNELSGMAYDEPRGLTVAEIEALVEKFALAAERAKKAGFDGIELNADSSHLFNSFLSRVWNKRQDAYGCGDLESRARFVVETIRAIKQRLGKGFPVSVLFNGAEYGMEKGTTLEEGQGFARILEKAGADALQVRAWGYGDYYQVHMTEEIFYPEPPRPLIKGPDWSRKGAGGLVPVAHAIKKVVSIPVIAVGRLDPEIGEMALRLGKVDFIGLTRRLIADPELPNKIATGRLEDIAPCTACLYCVDAIELGQQYVRCRVNAALGEGREYKVRPAKKRKRVVVVGGGPAGMEAARVAALREHEVTLIERERRLGGLLPLAAVIKGLEVEDLTAMVRYLEIQVNKLGVKVILGKEVNLSVIEEIKPDVVILATGGVPVLPEIRGINRSNVVGGPELHRRLKTYLRFLGPKALRWLTRFWMPVGKKVVVIGGGIQGCELAEFLVKRGRIVTIVDTGKTLGDEIATRKRARLFKWLDRKGATTITEARYEEITKKGLTIINKGGERQTIRANTIVPAIPLRPNTELFKILEGKVPEIYLIGDGREPHLIIDAIEEGSRIASAI